LPDSSLAGQEHGRTIPLADIRWTHILMIRVQDTSHELRGVLLCCQIIVAPDARERL